MNSILALFKNNAGQNGNDNDGGAAVVDAPPPVLDTVAPPATPPMYAVLLQNDDSSLPDFVMLVLVQVFGKSESAAMEIMIRAHNSGKSVVTIVSRDMAETLVAQAQEFITGFNGRKSMLPGGVCELTFTSVIETPGDAS